MKSEPGETAHVDHLVVALLSVGGYPLQRTRDRLEKIREAGLTDPNVVRALSEAAVVTRLAGAGYDRGPEVTTSMARRLIALHAAVRDGVLDRALVLLTDKKTDDARAILCKIKGIGPGVFGNFLALEGR